MKQPACRPPLMSSLLCILLAAIVPCFADCPLVDFVPDDCEPMEICDIIVLPEFAFTPPAGPFVSEQFISISFNDPEATIRYTLDGREPTDSDPVFISTTAIRIDGDVTITAKACSPRFGGGFMQSAAYQFYVGQIDVHPPPGTVVSGTAVEVTIQEGASLFASFEAAPAGAVSEWFPYDSPIIITSNVTFHLKGSKPAYQPALRTVGYQIPRLPRPEFVPSRGPIVDGALLTVTSSIPDVTIRYTLDGTQPREDSPEYTGPLRVNGGSQLRARAFKLGYNASFVKYTYYRGESNAPPRECANSLDLPRLKLTAISGADRPVWITHAGDGTKRLFFVEAPGLIKVAGQSAPFLDLAKPDTNTFVLNPLGQQPRVSSLVSVAFPPEYDSKAYFYVSYISPHGVLVISRFSALANPDVADASSEEIIATLPPPVCNGGQLVFSRDGALYFNSVGPIANVTLPEFEQDLNALSGKMIAILNESGLPLTNTSTHPFWPFAQHFSATNCAVVGGAFSEGESCRMEGLYFYRDSFGRIHALRRNGMGWGSHLLASPFFSTGFPVPGFESRPFRITAFGTDEDGAVYVANSGASIWWQEPPELLAVEHILGGGIYRVEDDVSVFSLRARQDGGERLTIEWHSAPARTYRLQASTNLVNWVDVLAPFPGTGEVLAATGLSVLDPEKAFFRVVVSGP